MTNEHKRYAQVLQKALETFGDVDEPIVTYDLIKRADKFNGTLTLSQIINRDTRMDVPGIPGLQMTLFTHKVYGAANSAQLYFNNEVLVAVDEDVWTNPEDETWEAFKKAYKGYKKMKGREGLADI
jgi:hypothetical protein